MPPFALAPLTVTLAVDAFKMTAALRLLAQAPAAAPAGGSRRRVACHAAQEPAQPQPGQLVFVLERRGDGWGEEIFPHLTLQRREPTPMRVMEVSSVQVLLRQAGLPDDVVTDIVSRATAWRSTTGGRQLLDRRKQRAVQRHAPFVLAALRAAGGPSLGAPQLQALLQGWPHLLELDAREEWERCFCALALRQHAALSPGEVCVSASAADAAWEEVQREAARLGLLNPERVALLDGVGFDWGLVDRDWEERFDELVAYSLGEGSSDTQDAVPTGPLLDWSRRQLALHRLGSLPAAAEARLRAVGFPFDDTVGGVADSRGDRQPNHEPPRAAPPAPAPEPAPAPVSRKEPVVAAAERRVRRPRAASKQKHKDTAARTVPVS